MKLVYNKFVYYYKQTPQEFQEFNNMIHASIPECVLQIPTPKLSVYGRILYLQIITQINETGYCNKSNSTLSKELTFSVRKVSSELKQCVKLHLLSVHYSNQSKKKGFRNFYLSPQNRSKLLKMNRQFIKDHHITPHKKHRKSFKQPTRVRVTQHQRSSQPQPKTNQVNQSQSTKPTNTEISSKPEKSLKQLTKKDQQIVDTISKKVSKYSPSYSLRNIKKTLISEYQQGKVNLHNINKAFLCTKIANDQNKVHHLVGFLCYESRQSEKDLDKKLDPSNPANHISTQERNYLDNITGGDDSFDF